MYASICYAAVAHQPPMAAVINEVLVAFDLVNKLLKLANVFGIRKYQALWSIHARYVAVVAATIAAASNNSSSTNSLSD